jgi:hypothetical protein
LGALMAFAGLGWLTYLSTPLANNLSPYDLAFGLLGEGLVMLWILGSVVAQLGSSHAELKAVTRTKKVSCSDDPLFGFWQLKVNERP